MSVKKFRFVSPGVFVNEIDNSQIPATPAGIGPVVIGRAEKGPALRPVTVNSFEEFVNTFGTPAPGGAGDDIWREGTDKSATTYGMYAAQAYLKNSSPLTYIRLLGAQTTADGGPAAGTAGEAGWSSTTAYGLVVCHAAADNDGVTTLKTQMTGALAAIFYADSGTVLKLSGSLIASGSGGIIKASTGVNKQTTAVALVADTGTNYEFVLDDGSNSTTFNFNENSSRYLRKVFNTNPQKTNSRISTVTDTYFLGESFDRHLKANITATEIAAGNLAQSFAAIIPLTDGTNSGADYAGHSVQSAQAPIIISNRTSLVAGSTSGVQNLFTLHALQDPGDWTNRNLKVSIQDIKRSSNDAYAYGTFSVVVRSLSDSDNTVRVIEQFDECDLNPDSLNYIARKIGDKFSQWSETERRYTQKGDWANNSKFIRVEMNSDVDAGMVSAELLPFGFQGMVKYNDEEISTYAPTTTSGNWISGSAFAGSATTGLAAGTWTTGSVLAISSSATLDAQAQDLRLKVHYPAPEFRVSASAGNLSNKTDAYFGYQTTPSQGSTRFDKSNIDLLRPRGGIVGSMFSGFTAKEERSVEFTLDDVCATGSLGGLWVSGSHTSVTSRFGPGVVQSYTLVSGAVSGVLDAGYDRFTVPMYGGFDGVNIKEMDPFNSSATTLPSTATDLNNYVFNSVRRAMDSVADPEVVEMNLATVPGLRQEGLTTNLINICEDRADALAIIDIPQGYIPRENSDATAATRRGNTSSEIAAAVNGIRDRGLNSSYGCTFYPWLRARDTLNGSHIWLPPSVAALGTFSSSQRKTQVWFAPAGFNRGGLTEGSAGIPVIDVAHQLRRKDRDDLYSANINPIAKFPAEGIVIFGQKTLQVTPSALDRINVRRLMIFVKKRISQMANQILFDPNIQVTWDRFTARVNPFLSSVKANFGLSDFKVVLDSTTTTPDLVDRNIMYAQIFLKPTRAIEYIAIDFNITRTGAAFVD
jgi:hypothetical protein